MLGEPCHQQGLVAVIPFIEDSLGLPHLGLLFAQTNQAALPVLTTCVAA